MQRLVNKTSVMILLTAIAAFLIITGNWLDYDVFTMTLHNLIGWVCLAIIHVINCWSNLRYWIEKRRGLAVFCILNGVFSLFMCVGYSLTLLPL